MRKTYLRESDFDEPPVNREELMEGLWRWIAIGCIVGLIAMLGFGAAHAQAVPGRADVSWTLPTQTVDGAPLTGAAALTELRLYVDTATIANTPRVGITPILIASSATSYAYSAQVQNGQTLFFRLAACNGPATARVCGALSNEASKVIQVSTVPGMPTNVTVTITINP